MNQKRRSVRSALETRPPRPPHETPPMMVNDISHLFFAKIRSMEPEGVLSQHSARVILRLLVRRDGLRQSEIARAAHLSAPSVSATLRKMENEGLVSRRADEGDGRAVGVYLTEQGRHAHDAMGHMLRTMDDCLMQGFDEQETAQLTALLERMRQNLLRDMQSTNETEETRP